MTDEPVGLTPSDMDEERNRLFREVLDFNADIVTGHREIMKALEVLRDAYLLQADRISDIIHLHAATVTLTAQSTGDILLAEFGLARVEDDDEDEESDDDREDS